MPFEVVKTRDGLLDGGSDRRGSFEGEFVASHCSQEDLFFCCEVSIGRGVVRLSGECSGSVYVAAVVYHEDRVLITDDGRVPMVDVDDTASLSDTSLMNNYYWLIKVDRPPAYSRPMPY